VFEDYLEDSYYFAVEAGKPIEERLAKRYYRASVFYAASAIEAFVNYIGDFLVRGGHLAPYELALLTDKRFVLNNGRFELLERFEVHGIEEKLKFLIYKFDPSFDFGSFPVWSQYMVFKDFRNMIVHPSHEEDEIDIKEYEKKVRMGLKSIIEIIDYLCNRIIKKPLRKKIKELTVA
jgi:hypothetical protein